VADFDGDGKPDLAVTNREGVRVLLGQGDGTFSDFDTLVLPISGVNGHPFSCH
jgi:hypothetical protein